MRGRCLLAGGAAMAVSAIVLDERDLVRIGLFVILLPLLSLAVALRAGQRRAAGEPAGLVGVLDAVQHRPARAAAGVGPRVQAAGADQVRRHRVADEQTRLVEVDHAVAEEPGVDVHRAPRADHRPHHRVPELAGRPLQA